MLLLAAFLFFLPLPFSSITSFSFSSSSSFSRSSFFCVRLKTFLFFSALGIPSPFLFSPINTTSSSSFPSFFVTPCPSSPPSSFPPLASSTRESKTDGVESPSNLDSSRKKTMGWPVCRIMGLTAVTRPPKLNEGRLGLPLPFFCRGSSGLPRRRWRAAGFSGQG